MKVGLRGKNKKRGKEGFLGGDEEMRGRIGKKNYHHAQHMQ